MILISIDKEKILNDLEKFEKLLENIIENLLLKENEEENFLIFCEDNLIERIIDITQYKEKKINLIIIKCFGILIPSLKNEKIIYYLFSNNYMNEIICNISYNNQEDDVDYLSFYINFLKTLANKLDLNSFSLFFKRNHHKFPLLDEIIIFLTYDKDIMIKNASRNIFLTLLKLNYKPFIEYICDIPCITLFLLFSMNLKNHFIYFCNLKMQKDINNINIIEDKKEILIDDLSFIQDILSINIPKINYILINSIFYISIRYLFNNILTSQNAESSFYILELIISILKNQSIKNIILFILYYYKIQINIIEIIANEEKSDIYKLLDLNFLVFKNILNINNDINNNDLLSFDDYIILNYSKRFLNSLRYIREKDNIYKELKEISVKLNDLNDTENESKIAIKLLNQNIKNINVVLKQIERYHNFISKATGINVGVSINISNHCFLQIIYNNLMAFYEKNLNYNDFLQENILKNACINYLTNFHLSQYLCTIYELLLIHQIINNKDISKYLKMQLNLLIDESNNDINNKNENNMFSIFNFIEDNNENCDTPPPPAALRFNAINKVYKNKSELYIDFFGLEKNDKKNNIYLTSLLSLPNIIINKTDINSYDDNNNLIVNNKIITYTDMDLNNEFFDKIFLQHKSDNEINFVNIIINLLLDKKRTLNKIIYKLCIDIISEFLLDSNNFALISEPLKKDIYDQYKQLLQIINEFLEKNCSIKDQIKKDKYIFDFFEKCFLFNSQSINNIKEKFSNAEILIINDKNFGSNIDKDLMKIPQKKNQMIKCLFQKFMALYDLKMIIFNYNNNYKQKLLKYQKFPIYFFDESNIKTFSEIYFSKLKIDTYKLKYKTEKDSLFEIGILIIYENSLLIYKMSKSDKTPENNNSINDNNIYIIDKIIPLRKIKLNEINEKEFDKSKYLILNINNEYKIILLLEDNSNIILFKNMIIHSIHKSIENEFYSLKGYFKNLLDDEVINFNF